MLALFKFRLQFHSYVSLCEIKTCPSYGEERAHTNTSLTSCFLPLTSFAGNYFLHIAYHTSTKSTYNLSEGTWKLVSIIRDSAASLLCNQPYRCKTLLATISRKIPRQEHSQPDNNNHLGKAPYTAQQ